MSKSFLHCVVMALMAVGAVSLTSCASAVSPVELVDIDTFKTPDGRVRLEGWDGPENRRDRTPGNDKHSGAQCEAEIELSKMGIAYAETLLKSARSVKVIRSGESCRHNRACGDLLIDGKRYSEIMAAAGYVKPWPHRKGKALAPRPDWCATRP